MDLLTPLAFPFMQRAIAAGLMLGLLLAVLGVFVTLRKMSFFGDGVAHASLAGIAIAVLAGVSPLPFALAWAVLVALLVYHLERSTRLPSDTLIGILFTSSMAIGVVLMSLTQGYQPELITFLFGNILSIRAFDVMIIGGLSSLILAWLLWQRSALTFTSFSEESARVAGINTSLLTLLLYVALALATVLGVKVLGIILVSALLILPPATARLLAGSFKGLLVISVIVGEIAVLVGLFASFYLDIPSGASIVLTGTLLFVIALLFSSSSKR